MTFLDGGGDAGAQIRAFDWAASPLGVPQAWPQSLRIAVRLMLGTRHPMSIFWGAQSLCFFNDAYGMAVGAERRARAIGRPARQVWDEAWPVVGPQIDFVMGGHGATWHENQLVPIVRDGRLHDAYWTYSYSPIDDEGAPGGIGGVLLTATETTPQVLSEQRLTRELHRQRELLQQMPGFVAVLSGPHHVFDYVNDAYVQIAGRRDFLGRGVREVFPELHDQGFYELLDEVYASGRRFVARTLPVRLEGEPEERFLDLLYEPIRDDAGAVSGIFVGGYDATETTRMQEALRATETRLRSINADLEREVAARTRERGRTWAVSPDLLSIVGADGRFESFNPAWQATLGWSEDALRGALFFDFVHPDDRERTLAAWKDSQRGQPVLHVENRYRMKDGGWRWLSWVAVPEGSKMYCSARDIDAEKQQSLALERTQAERDRVWLHSRDVITVIDLNGVVRSVNPAVRDVLGWSPQEMLGRSVMDFIHPGDRPPTQGGALISHRYTEPRVFLNRFLGKDGSYRFMSWLAAASPDGLIYSSGRDTTEARAQAEALRAAEESLRQSQKMEAVGQLTGGIAHDFNNLLMGISGSLQMLAARIAQGRTDDVDRYIGAAQAAAKRAAALTHRLLAFARRQTLDPKPVDVNRLLADVEELIRRTVGPAIELEVVGAGGLWATLVDANQLENALLNLCINARDAMPNGGRITIETANQWLDERSAQERDLPPGPYLSVCVTDTGTGMTPEVAAKAFDPFFTTKPLGMGTGLGLSMIYGFARQSGGQVRICSEVGRGTTMCIDLPRHVGDAPDAEPLFFAAQAARAGVDETVLVVDDEPTVRMLVVDVLTEAGFRVIEADDGRSGLQLLQSTPRVDLLVTDVGLPGGMNGRQLADAARVSRPDLKVLFITGYAETAVVGNGHLAPGMAVLTKPFDIESLNEKIREMTPTPPDAAPA